MDRPATPQGKGDGFYFHNDSGRAVPDFESVSRHLWDSMRWQPERRGQPPERKPDAHPQGSPSPPHHQYLDFSPPPTPAYRPEIEPRDRLEHRDKIQHKPARVQEFYHLHNRSADHGRTPDAVIRIPPDFNASKPFDVVVYNHGFYSTAQSSVPYNHLDKLMGGAAPNTVLVLPEWQVRPSAASSSQGRFADRNRFSNMLQEIFDKTPELRGKTVKDIANIDIFSHSAGHNAASSELYHNGLGDKIRTVVDLDSQYNPHVYDRWIENNLHDLSKGKKHFYSIGEDRIAATEGLANRVSRMLRSARLPDQVVRDYSHPKSTPGSHAFSDHSLVFKHSTATLRGRGPHMSIPELYFGEIIKSLKRER